MINRELLNKMVSKYIKILRILLYEMDSFINEWFQNKNWWFNCDDTIDTYLIKYEFLLDTIDCINIITNYKNPIHIVIVYDQLSRHIYRKEYASHIISYFLNKALEILMSYKYNQHFIDNLNYDEFIFFILPFRHSNIKENILYAISQIINKKPFCKRFLSATYERANFIESFDNDYYKICDDYNRDILEYNPLNDVSHLQYKIGDFDLINKYFIENHIDNGIISLSGGVDSMVCLINCVKLYPNIKWTCININYNNRTFSGDESKFVANFCNNYNIPIYIRKISEINRDFCKKNDMREIYEKYTKRVRFNCYKSINKEKTLVILGHNNDDCFENILTNIANSNKYNNLKGMNNVIIQDDITFIRPLLNVSKDNIYEFAEKHFIPYLKNSTPLWSQRGKIRNTIVPTLKDWNSNIITGLFNLTEILKDFNYLLENNVNSFIDKFIIMTNDNNKSADLLISKKDLIINNKLFWKNVFFKLFNNNLSQPSNKSLINFINMLEIWSNNYYKLELNKYTNIIISKNINFKICKLSADNCNIIIDCYR